MTNQKYTVDSKVWEKLYEGELLVKFTKKDGTERIMRCTLKMDDIPTEMHPKSKVEYDSVSVKRVFDLDKQAWRSFRYDSVIEVR